jgi:hypothetical protein
MTAVPVKPELAARMTVLTGYEADPLRRKSPGVPLTPIPTSSTPAGITQVLVV